MAKFQLQSFPKSANDKDGQPDDLKSFVYLESFTKSFSDDNDDEPEFFLLYLHMR